LSLAGRSNQILRTPGGGFSISKSVLNAITSLLAGLGVNIVPAAAAFLSGSAEAAMIIYFLENLIVITLATALVRIKAPARDETARDHRTRKSLLQTYLMVALGFTLVNGVFIATILFLFSGADVPRDLILWGIALAAVFQLASFTGDVWQMEPLTLDAAGTVLEKSLGRVFLLHLGVFIGVIIAAFFRQWFVVPFIVLKTIVDVGTPIQALLHHFQAPSNGGRAGDQAAN
jgi:cytochrome c biogenesis protein CcdA